MIVQLLAMWLLGQSCGRGHILRVVSLRMFQKAYRIEARGQSRLATTHDALLTESRTLSS